MLHVLMCRYGVPDTLLPLMAIKGVTPKIAWWLVKAKYVATT